MTTQKPRVRKSRKDGRWIAKLPILAGGVLVGWYSERFDKHEFAFTFASRGPVLRDNEPTDLDPTHKESKDD